MKRQRRSKGAPIMAFFKEAKDVVVARVIAIAVAVLFVIIFYFLVNAFLSQSDYFRLRGVETKGVFLDNKTSSIISSQLLGSYRGRSIFKINLKNVAESIRRAYPDSKELTVSISLPDKMIVNLKLRRPVAVVKNARLYPIDGDGVILWSMDPANLKSLPLIEGIDMRSVSKKTANAMAWKLRIVLNLLTAIREAKYMSDYCVDRIDASDLMSLTFYIRTGPEVRIGFENFKERLDKLAKILKDPRMILSRIRYIDLRFKDVVIGPEES